ncbi:hypothetical protein BOTBODRAFT_28644 [Botryobasidium botryosum FD-172 SS1]|uniref:Holocytochrome c-type synthase n=1 Tax=Botryobasidium botryosum (strain FD-172 SS1) TaxID=930990 RepID=A0A067MU65_BOTB1|nr:hypothetical protein BOTBODRAFT_28644 [Botryobasidium botryosum FD-172 SS1]
MGQSASQPSPALPPSHPPVSPHASPSDASPPPSCPMHKSQEQQRPAQCPVQHDSGALNPHNQMPLLAQHPTSSAQTVALPTERTISSIPRPPTPDAPNKWEYPSPQQFYNALVRKGWETPEEHVETMVDIHNFINEEAWREVCKWEAQRDATAPEPILERFQGKPGDLSPKARILLLAGYLFPSHFNTEPPFDRHDWIIRRPNTSEEVRYVIDYYTAPPTPHGDPVYSLDVRPALDSVDSIRQRIRVATKEAWENFASKEAPQ